MIQMTVLSRMLQCMIKRFYSSFVHTVLPGDSCRSTTECQKQDCHGGTCTTGYFQCLTGLKWYITSVDGGLQDGKCVPENCKYSLHDYDITVEQRIIDNLADYN